MLRRAPRELLEEYNVYNPNIYNFPLNARLLQSIWREKQGCQYESSGHWLSDSDAKQGNNFLTESIHELALKELQISDDDFWRRLDYMPTLAYNLFGELKIESGFRTANKVFTQLLPGRLGQITGIEFDSEYEYFAGCTARFPVFIEYSSAEDERCFWGIMIRYTEGVCPFPQLMYDEYRQIAQAMGIFKPEAINQLETTLQEFWLKQLLVGSIVQNSDYDRGDFVVLYPKDNLWVHKAAGQYLDALIAGENYFVPLTLEKFHRALAKTTDAPWVAEFYDRYLNFARLEEL